MEETIKTLINNVNNLLIDINNFKDEPSVLINIINNFQDDNVEILQLTLNQTSNKKIEDFIQ